MGDLIDNEERGSPFTGRPMGHLIVPYNVHHPLTEGVDAPVLVFRVDFPADTQDDMPFAAPMVRRVAGGIVHHSDAKLTVRVGS